MKKYERYLVWALAAFSIAQFLVNVKQDSKLRTIEEINKTQTEVLSNILDRQEIVLESLKTK